MSGDETYESPLKGLITTARDNDFPIGVVLEYVFDKNNVHYGGKPMRRNPNEVKAVKYDIWLPADYSRSSGTFRERIVKTPRITLPGINDEVEKVLAEQGEKMGLGRRNLIVNTVTGSRLVYRVAAEEGADDKRYVHRAVVDFQGYYQAHNGQKD